MHEHTLLSLINEVVGYFLIQQTFIVNKIQIGTNAMLISLARNCDLGAVKIPLGAIINSLTIVSSGPDNVVTTDT